MKKFPIVAFPIIQEILDKSESFLDSIVSKIEAEYIKDSNRVFTDYKR